MFFSKKQTRSTTLPAITRPIHYYSEDSLNFNSSRAQLYGEIYSKEQDAYLDETYSSNSRISHNKSRYVLATLLYYSIALLSLASTALFATVIPLWEQNFEHTQSPVKGDWTDGLTLLPLSISLISSIYIIYSMHKHRRRQKHQYQPFAHDYRSKSNSNANLRDATPLPFYTILLSATILLSLPPLLILSSTNSLARAFRSGPAPFTTRNGVKVCNLSNVLTKPCIPILYRIGELQIGGAATGGMLCSLWIIVLILSIRQYYRLKVEEKRRKQERRQLRHARRRARRQARRHNQERGQRQAQRHPTVGDGGTPKDDLEQGIVGEVDYSRVPRKRTDDKLHSRATERQLANTRFPAKSYQKSYGQDEQFGRERADYEPFDYRESEHIISMGMLASRSSGMSSSDSLVHSSLHRHNPFANKPRQSMRAWMSNREV